YAKNQNHLITPPVAGTPADDAVSVIASVEWQGNTNWQSATLHETSRLVLDGSSANQPKVYGVCGMAVGDIIPASSLIAGSAEQELVVTSLMGHLLVYELHSDGTIGNLLYQAQVDGALGVYSSIVIADLDNPPNGNELYVAGSLGLRKWIF